MDYEWIDCYPEMDDSFYYMCPKCNHVVDDPSPPDHCPECGLDMKL